jgi:hypothetical protein
LYSLSHVFGLSGTSNCGHKMFDHDIR